MAHTACNTDHETTKGFSLLTSLRQHFAALRQQDAVFPALQPQTTPDGSSTPCWVQPYDLQLNSHKTTVLGSRALTLSDPQCINIQPGKHTKEPIRFPGCSRNNKVRRHKQRQHHKWHQQQQKHQERFLHNKHAVSHLLAEDPQSPQRLQPEPANLSAPQEAVSCEGAATASLGQALQVHHLRNCCVSSVGYKSTLNQQSSLQQFDNSTPSSPDPGADAIKPYITQASARDSRCGCIRAQPRLMWQNPLKPTDSIPDKTHLLMGLNQGQQTAHTFQIAFDLSKAGQLRTQNLHAAVRASLHLLHRFVVRRSAIAHMGVFTTGISLACLNNIAYRIFALTFETPNTSILRHAVYSTHQSCR